MLAGQPTIRFINADGYVNANGDFIGFNMFAYCSNNPVMGYDPTGTINWGNILKASAVVVGITAVVALSVVTFGTAAVAAGAVTASVVVAATAGAVVGGLAAGATEIAVQCVTNGSDNLDYKDIAIETFAGAVIGAIEGATSSIGTASSSVIGKAAKIGVNGLRSGLHSYNHHDDALTVCRNASASMLGTAIIQGCLAKSNCYSLSEQLIRTGIVRSMVVIGRSILSQAKDILMPLFDTKQAAGGA